MKQWVGVVGAIVIATQVHAQSDATSGTAFYPSCLAAADIVQGKRPAADSEDAARQLRQASACFGAVTAIMKLEPFLKPEFAVCPPPDVLRDSKGILAQMILSITASYCLNFLTQRPAHIKSANSGLGKVAWRLFLGLLSLPSIV
jgi:hypothetical protein